MFDKISTFFSTVKSPTIKPVKGTLYNQVGSCMDFTECLAVLERHREKQHSADLDGHCEENVSYCRTAGSETVGKNSGENDGPAWLSPFIYTGITRGGALCSLVYKERNGPTCSCYGYLDRET